MKCTLLNIRYMSRNTLTNFAYPITVIVVCFCLSISVLQAQNTPESSLVFEGSPLKEVLIELENKFSVKFSYIETLVEGKEITSRPGNNDINKVLDQILEEFDLSFKELKPGQYVIFQTNDSRKFDVSGEIKDVSAGQPIPFATIFIRDSNTSTISDVNGKFLLPDVLAGSTTLEINSAGYEPVVVKIKVAGNESVAVRMQESLVHLQTVEISPDAYEFSSTPRLSFDLNREELLSPPNIARDLIRNMKLIPGVSNDDISAKTRIRGGDWDETGIFFDDLEIYEPFHLEEVNGFASIFDIDLVRRSKILTGGFSSRYTNKMSGIIEVNTSDYVSENSTLFSIDLLGGRFNTQQRITDKIDVLGSFRRGYLDLFVRSGENGIKPRYYDGYLKVNHRLNPKNHLSYHFLYSSDDLEFNTDLAISRPEFFDSQRRNFYVWTNWKWLFNDKFSNQTTVGFQQLKKDSRFQFESSLSEDNQDLRDSRIFSVNHRNYLETSSNNDLEFGLEFKAFDSQYVFSENRVDQLQSSADTVFTNFINVNTQLSGHTIGIYVQDTWMVSETFSINGGLRLSRESFTGKSNLAPRIAISQQLDPNLIFKLSYGIYFQPENFQKIRVYEGRNSLSTQVMKSIHYVGSFNYKKNGIELLLSGYYKDYPMLFDDYRFDFYNRATLVNIIDHQDFETNSGKSSGFEVFIRRQFEKGFLGLNYTYAISKISNQNGEETYRDFDRRHTVNFNTVIRLGRQFTFSTNWSYHSGNPYTESSVQEISNNIPNELAYFDLDKKNAQRLPSYHSLDIKFEKTWTGKTVKTAYLNIINTYNRANIRNYHWNGEVNTSGQTVINRVSVGLPEFFVSPGFKIQF